MNKKILAVILLVALVFTLSACGSSTSNTKSTAYLGTYEGSVEIEGMDDAVSAAMSQLEGMEGMEGVDLSALQDVDMSAIAASAVGMTVTLSAEDKFTMAIAGQEVEGTFKVEGTKLTLTVDGDPVEGTLENGTITLEQDGMKFVLNKK